MSRNNCNHKPTRREDWGTPRWLFDALDRIFLFSIDLAASKANAKSVNWIDETDNLLSGAVETIKAIFPDSSGLIMDGWGWCNPPYGKSGCDKWMKAIFQVPNTVSLIPSSVGSKWFLQCWQQASAIVQFHKRLRYDGAPGPAQFDSCLVVKGGALNLEQLDELSTLGTVIYRGGIIHWKGEWLEDKTA